ncbi:selenium metabolism-associated LysR family transcriptional regulator [Geomesophilobacter sediminis]|uniref:LysR family transcriptional regulator n=1 Tax=Geomesophilobacter sediminis TaxID=2798584 RepID=A0A8J7JH90_9BACT|nr:selenium metabolism-associated LysR family transcriptional regulator [Geomesophilobacter sediminis]MBJ6723855.1 LysR family transcriptional regulator [Geomesophilobacter sediminis]
MNLKQLEVFLAVADSGSFSKGAEATFITQSTVSQHILALEEEFGLKLFDRTGKGALLTEGGKILMERARRLCDYAHEIPTAMERFKGVEEAFLKIAGSSIPGEYMIPAALPLLIRRYPGLSITILQGDSKEVLERLLSEQVEFGVVGGYFAEDALEFTPLDKDEIILVAAAGHRWAGAGTIVMSDLLQERFVVREAGSGTAQAAFEALREAGVDAEAIRIAARLGSNNAVKRAVMEGVGVSFLSAVSVERELSQGALVRVPVQGITINRQFYLVQRKGRDLSPAARAFAEVMRELYGPAARA